MNTDLFDNIRRVVPYTPGEQPKDPDIIKLNTNENPYPPAPGVRKAAELLDTDLFRLYPDPTSACLVDALAAYHGIDADRIFVGVGSDDVLSMSFLTFFNSAKPILFPDITYSFYDVWAGLYRIPYTLCALDEEFHIRREDYCRENGGIVIPNPNAPTGVYEEPEVFEAILRANPGVVVIVDEAYVDFASGASVCELLDRYPNLLVVRTFSKSRSMAGMRIGYAMGSKELIKALNDVKYSFNSYTMSRAALILGAESVKDDEYFREHVKKICDTRESTKVKLKELGFHFPDSQSNFIFASHAAVPAAKLFEELKKRGIYVRYFNKAPIDNYLRITVGTDEQMDRLICALREIIAE